MTILQEFPVDLPQHIEVLTKARQVLLEELASTTPDQLTLSKNDGWTIPQIAHHLHLVEGRITGFIEMGIKNLTGLSPASVEQRQAEWERVVRIVPSRQNRVDAPEAVRPTNTPASLEEVKTLLAASRTKLLELLNQTNLEQLDSISLPHPNPMIGVITGASWLIMMASHELRHVAQIKELKNG